MAIPIVAGATIATIAAKLLKDRLAGEMSNKDSSVRKTFDSAIDQVVNGMSTEDVVAAITGSNNVQDVEKRLKNYKKPVKQWFVEYIPKILGGLAKTAGNYWNAQNSILANALMSAANNRVSPEVQRVYGNPYARAAALYGAGKLAQGALAGAAGNFIGGQLEDFSKDAAAEFEKMRNTRALIEEGAPGLYFDAQRKQANAQKR